ncbi:MAG: NDP-sugar synthase [Promethearchaeia archaeon]
MEKLEKINDLLKQKEINVERVKDCFETVLKKEISYSHKISKFEGDFPTFIEPVYIGENVKIGDDVMIGPNVYIGKNVTISDYVEITNTIILDGVTIGENLFFEKCIVGEGSNLNFRNARIKNKIILGEGQSLDEIKQVPIIIK